MGTQTATDTARLSATETGWAVEWADDLAYCWGQAKGLALAQAMVSELSVAAAKGRDVDEPPARSGKGRGSDRDE